MKRVLLRLVVTSDLWDKLEEAIRARGVPAEQFLEELLRGQDVPKVVREKEGAQP
jgi:hypothetical protein